MASYVTPEELYASLETADAQLREKTRAFFIAQGREAKKWARYYSSGTLTYKNLRLLGHPYAANRYLTAGGRRSSPNVSARASESATGQPAALINKHSGYFARAWRWQTWETGESVQGMLWNDAPYASFLFRGTKVMIPRPTFSAILFQLEPQFQRQCSELLADYVAGVFKAR